MCESMRAFTRSSLDTSGLRRAWFLPFGSYEDGSFDFYAPMASSPSDDASKAFYDKRVGQLTHYTVAPEFAKALVSCLSARYGYSTSCEAGDEETFRASLADKTTGRLIEISAADDTTSILIAEGGWSGDIAQAMRYSSDAEETPNKPIHATCEDARA
jgi:hypothetical protein